MERRKELREEGRGTGTKRRKEKERESRGHENNTLIHLSSDPFLTALPVLSQVQEATAALEPAGGALGSRRPPDDGQGSHLRSPLVHAETRGRPAR